MRPLSFLVLTASVLGFAPSTDALTLNYSDVDPAGVLDTTVAGVPARLIGVTEDDLLLQADAALTINLSFRNGQALFITPAADPPGLELLNLALVSPAVNGTPPSAALTGTITPVAAGDFNPGSGIPLGFDSTFVPNSPLVAADVILLRQAANLTDTGYVLQSLQYQISVPAGFDDYQLTAINLLVTGSAFSVVPLPASLLFFFSALFATATLRRRARAASGQEAPVAPSSW